MGAGDIQVQILETDVETISGALAAMRVTANDKWLMCSVANGMQVVIGHIEEA